MLRVVFVIFFVLMSAGGCDAGSFKACGFLTGMEPCERDEDEEEEGPNSSAPPPSSSSGGEPALGPLPAADTVVSRLLSTNINVPVLFELNPADPGSIVHTNWIMPVTGELQFINRPHSAVFHPSLDSSGSNSFSIQVERRDGTHERTNVRVAVADYAPVAYPWACPSTPRSAGAFTAVAAHPQVADSLIVLERDGLGLVSGRSVDGGRTWRSGGPLPASDITALGFAAGNSAKLHATGASGFYVSTDGGLTWAAETPPAPVPIYPRYRIAGTQLWRADAADDEYLVAGHHVPLMALGSDPANSRRQYVLAEDGLYLLFRDGTPGPNAREAEQLVRAADVAANPTGLAVDSRGRVWISSESGIDCVEGDKPFEPMENRVSVSMRADSDSVEAGIILLGMTEAAEVTLWLAGSALHPNAPGVAPVSRKKVKEWNLPGGEDASLTAALPIEASGFYDLAAVVRTRDGIQARSQTNLTVSPGARLFVNQDLALTGTLAVTGFNTTTYDLTLVNNGANPVAVPSLAMTIQPGTDFSLQQPLDPHWDQCALLANRLILRCEAAQPLPVGGSMALRLQLMGVDSSELSATAFGPGNEVTPFDNVWSATGSRPGSVSISSRSLIGPSQAGSHLILRLDITNSGDAPVQPVVNGIVSGFGPELDPGRWMIGSAYADCLTPIRYCPTGVCETARRSLSRYTCRFHRQLLSGESASISVEVPPAVSGSTLTHSAVVETWDEDGWNNLNQLSVTVP
jgi:hypothetical protein